MATQEFIYKRAGEFRSAVLVFREMALEVDELALLFDDGGKACPACNRAVYRAFAQRTMRARIVGLSESMRSIADTLDRRARDPQFIGEPKPATAELSAAHRNPYGEGDPAEIDGT